MTSICTLYELGRALAGLKDKKRFEELKLGPLCKLPLIHRMFKIDSNTKDDDIRQIETVDILKVLVHISNTHRVPPAGGKQGPACRERLLSTVIKNRTGG